MQLIYLYLPMNRINNNYATLTGLKNLPQSQVLLILVRTGN